MKRVRSIVELILTVAFAAALAFLVQAFIVKPYRIPSGSMIPTLDINQRILVNRLETHPGLGAVVVFHPPHGADLSQNQCANANQGFNLEGSPDAQPCDRPLPGASPETFVKRVVGLPGDTIQISNGHVIRNGRREPDAYISACGGSPECTFAKAVKVPAGDYYMMGDNRGNSDDSRYWGPVPRHDIIGEAFFTYWPLSRVGTL
jgi:signal peptidase I